MVELIGNCVSVFEERPKDAAHLMELLSRVNLEESRAVEPHVSAAPAAATGPSAVDQLLRQREKDLERKQAEANAAKKQQQDKQMAQLQAVLAGQLERDQCEQAAETVAAMLRVRPKDPEALRAKKYLDQTLPERAAERERLKHEAANKREQARREMNRRARSGAIFALLIVPLISMGSLALWAIQTELQDGHLMVALICCGPPWSLGLGFLLSCITAACMSKDERGAKIGLGGVGFLIHAFVGPIVFFITGLIGNLLLIRAVFI
jgi:hypothetical protein